MPNNRVSLPKIKQKLLLIVSLLGCEPSPLYCFHVIITYLTIPAAAAHAKFSLFYSLKTVPFFSRHFPLDWLPDFMCTTT